MSEKQTTEKLRVYQRWILQTTGLVSLGLGFAGAFLPLLPTTPFILLSAWCFAKSSPKWHRYIHEHREFGPLIRNWQSERSITLKHKLVAGCFILFSILGLSVSERTTEFKIGLSLGLSTIFFFLLLTKTSKS